MILEAFAAFLLNLPIFYSLFVTINISILEDPT